MASQPEFPIGRRGYEIESVDLYVARSQRRIESAERELTLARDRVADLESNLRTARADADAARAEAARPSPPLREPAPPTFAALGEEVARVLETAHAAALELRRAAERDTEAMQSAARQRNDELMRETESRIAMQTADADRTLRAAEGELALAEQRAREIVSTAEAESSRKVAALEDDARRRQLAADAALVDAQLRAEELAAQIQMDAERRAEERARAIVEDAEARVLRMEAQVERLDLRRVDALSELESLRAAVPAALESGQAVAPARSAVEPLAEPERATSAELEAPADVPAGTPAAFDAPPSTLIEAERPASRSTLVEATGATPDVAADDETTPVRRWEPQQAESAAPSAPAAEVVVLPPDQEELFQRIFRPDGGDAEREVDVGQETTPDLEPELEPRSIEAPAAPSEPAVGDARALGRRLKRVLQDEQNNLLDNLRQTNDVAETLVMLAAADALRDRLASATAELDQDRDAIGLAVTIADPLHGELRAVLDVAATSGEGVAIVSDRISAIFRVWRIERIDTILDGS